MPLDKAIVIEDITLAGGGSDILFEPLTGDTDEYGTFVVKKAASMNGQQVMTVTHAGQVSGN